MNYEEELNRLKEAQKQAAIASLDKQKNEALSGLQREEAAIKPTYENKRNTANVQNQVNAKNFHEYLINTGRSNSGIGAQYEMSRQNRLASDIGALNRQEAAAMGDIARRRTDVGNAYQSGLAGANAQIESNYIQNLLNERQKAWQREQAEKQFQNQLAQQEWQRQQAERQMAMRYVGGSGRGSSSRGYSSSRKPVQAQQPEISSGAQNFMKFYEQNAQNFHKDPMKMSATLADMYNKKLINDYDLEFLVNNYGLGKYYQG